MESCSYSPSRPILRVPLTAESPRTATAILPRYHHRQCHRSRITNTNADLFSQQPLSKQQFDWCARLRQGSAEPACVGHPPTSSSQPPCSPPRAEDFHHHLGFYHPSQHARPPTSSSLAITEESLGGHCSSPLLPPPPSSLFDTFTRREARASLLRSISAWGEVRKEGRGEGNSKSGKRGRKEREGGR